MALKDHDKLIYINMLPLGLTLLTLFMGKVWHSLDIVLHPILVSEVLVLLLSAITMLTTLCTSINKPKLSNAMPSAAVYLTSVIIYHSIAVVYGAPLSVSFTETFHFSWVLSTVTVLPALCILGPKADEWLRVLFLNKPENIYEKNLQWRFTCAVLGAWLGAFPIPLDWDTPWQVWPVSCLLGTLIGYMVGLILGSNRVYLDAQMYSITTKTKTRSA